MNIESVIRALDKCEQDGLVDPELKSKIFNEILLVNLDEVVKGQEKLDVRLGI
jgi:hypothetical protein